MGINKETSIEDLANQSKKTKRKRRSLKVNLSQCNCAETSENQQRVLDIKPDFLENPVEHETNPCEISKNSEGNLQKGQKCSQTNKLAYSERIHISGKKSKPTYCKNTKAGESYSSIPDANNDRTVLCKENNSVKNVKRSGKRNAVLPKDSLQNKSSDNLQIVTQVGKLGQTDNSLLNHSGSVFNKSTPFSKVDSNSRETISDSKKLSKSKRRRIRKKRSLASLGVKNYSEEKLKEPTEGHVNASASSKYASKSLYISNFASGDLVKPCETDVPVICRANRKKELFPLCNKSLCISDPPKGGEIHCVGGKLFEASTSLSVLNSISNDSFCCEAPNVKGNACLVTGNNSNAEKRTLENQGHACGNVKHSTEPHVNVTRREDNFSEKVNLPNFLSHDNVEGLFRSALLNDITLSSRCSEKEVKNFFNTYGTFSEKNRSQFAEVEKLLSSNKAEGSSNSLFFGSERKECVRDSIDGNSLDSRHCIPLPPLPSLPSNVQDFTETVANSTCGEGTFEYNSSIDHLSSGILPESTDVNRGGRDPICTSPNAENTVIDSLSNSQSLREIKTASPSLSSNLNSPRLIPDKAESRLLEIVENVLLVHERVREQLTSEKKSQKVCTNLPVNNSFSPSESKDFSAKHTSKTGNANYDCLRNNKSVFESSQPESIFPVDSTSKKKSTLCESISPIVFSGGSSGEILPPNCEKCVTEFNKMQKTDKSKDEIKAEREAKKLAKLARKQKAAGIPDLSVNNACGGDAVSIKKNVGNKQLEVSAQDKKTAMIQSSKKDVVDDKKRDSKTELTTSSTCKSVDVAKDSNSTAEGRSKSKAELKAERRAKQETQRAAKLLQQEEPTRSKGSNEIQNKKPQTHPSAPKVAEGGSIKAKLANDKDSGKEVVRAVPVHKVKLFNHLYVKQEASVPKSIFATSNLHPAIVRLGVQYATKIVVGSNARCLALLSAVTQVIEDFKTPPQQEFSRGLGAVLQLCMSFLQECRPLSVSMTNAVKYLKWKLRKLPNNISDVDAKKKLQEAVDTYIREQIEVAGQAICNTVIEKISCGDVILTYGCSSLLQRILIKAHKNGTKFKVIIVDARPWREGKEMLRRLVGNGLCCSYVVITAASFVMREATKVFLGAHALLANGYVMSRAGSSQVALLAHSYNVPVLVCCETHKFSERVQTDSIVYNELGAPDELVITDLFPKDHPLSKWRAVNNLTPLNLTYDVTPPDLVTAVVTELAILPCTSVPVILRIKPTEIGY